jgi:crotonobetainyl-CoA:carnitine CoA-transferase CaiB-like acyl-CoA transferase
MNPDSDSRVPGPLDGVRVLELGQLIAGPFCGQLLGDFGADVVKVEALGDGDPMRRWGVCVDGRSLSWSVIARNKRAICLDLRSREGLDVALDLAAQADVVVENFRVGTLERLGMGWDVLHARNPRTVLVRISGFGQDGPYAERAGFGSIGEAMGGLRHLTGDADRPPTRVGVSIGDMLAGMQGAYGALLALRARDRTGEGQVVDVSLYEAVLSVTEALASEYVATGRVRGRTGSILPGIAPSNVYPTADGSWVLIAANHDGVFARLTEAMGDAGLSEDPAYRDHLSRGARQEELDGIVARWTKGLTKADLLATLDAHGVPAGTVYTAADMVSDPQYIARDSLVTVPDPVIGTVTMQNVFPRLSDTPGSVRWSGPTLDQHRDGVLAEVTAQAKQSADHG